MLQELAHKFDIVTVVNIYLDSKVFAEAMRRDTIKTEIFTSSL